MISTLRIFALLALALGMAACAGPRYQTVFRYDAPSDAAGRTCLEGCTQKLAECRERCTATNLDCMKSLEPLVDERYNEALRRHDAELERYRLDLYLSPYWGYPSPWRHGLLPFSTWATPYAFPPDPPVKPSRSTEFEQVRHERCDVDCGCQPVYDACFLACGGKKIPQVQCLGNCPPAP